MALDPPALHVLSFEPIASTHRVLQENVRLNHLESRVHIFRMAASNRSYSTTMCDMASTGDEREGVETKKTQNTQISLNKRPVMI